MATLVFIKLESKFQTWALKYLGPLLIVKYKWHCVEGIGGVVWKGARLG